MAIDIPLGQPYLPETAKTYLLDSLNSKLLSGDNFFTKKCNEWLTTKTKTHRALLTPSCTDALELCALLCEIEPDDEVILPSFTFSSTANAFALRGARLKFVDVRYDTLNINESMIEKAITKKTKAIIPVHYAGVSCEMDVINTIAKNYNLYVVEDAAQGLMAKYNGKDLGTLGTLGCLSFHDTKNYTSGEGGAILINDARYLLRAEVIREKGTNRAQFFRGFVDKYSWVDIGSSYLPSDLSSALLFAQLEIAEQIHQKRMHVWDTYYSLLKSLAEKNKIVLPYVPKECEHNAHIFYIRVFSLELRTKLIAYLRGCGVGAAFHYVPLHSSTAGKKFGEFIGTDQYTTSESEKLIRLPIYASMTDEQIQFITESIRKFFDKE